MSNPDSADSVLVLVVEDLAETVVSDALAQNGYTVVVACSAEAVLACVEAGSVQAIVVDLMIREPDGLALCHTLRHHARTASLPLIAVGPHDDATVRAEAIDAGADVYLTRPLDWMEILHHMWLIRARDVPRSPVFAFGALSDEEYEGVMRLLGHDLKGPSHDIISSLQLLREGELDRAACVRLAERALGAAGRQLRLIDQMLDLARLDHGSFPLDSQPLALAEVIEEGLGSVRAMLAQKRVHLENRADKTTLCVAADRVLLVRVWCALLYNSLKFCVPGDTLTISALAEAGTVMLVLRDTGRPISADYIDVIFNIANQWRARESGSRSSVAWGLPFCRSAMRAMQGDLVVHSSAAHPPNTTFILKLPRSTRSK